MNCFSKYEQILFFLMKAVSNRNVYLGNRNIFMKCNDTGYKLLLFVDSNFE